MHASLRNLTCSDNIDNNNNNNNNVSSMFLVRMDLLTCASNLTEEAKVFLSVSNVRLYVSSSWGRNVHTLVKIGARYADKTPWVVLVQATGGHVGAGDVQRTRAFQATSVASTASLQAPIPPIHEIKTGGIQSTMPGACQPSQWTERYEALRTEKPLKQHPISAATLSLKKTRSMHKSNTPPLSLTTPRCRR